MKVQLYADFTCPFSYMGKRQLDLAIEAYGKPVAVELKAFQLTPEASTEQAIPTVELLAKKFGRSQEETLETTKRLQQQAASLGLTYNYDTMKAPNTKKAHRLTKWAAAYGKHEAAIEAFFKALFTDGADLNDEATLLQIVEQLHLPVDEAKALLASDDLAQAVDADKQEALKRGIRSVPVAIVNDTYIIQGVQPFETYSEAFRKAEQG